MAATQNSSWVWNRAVSAFFVVSFLKLLLMNGYRSTDFEVHRNWLAITHSLPLTEWYVEATSEWTLDYPPLFAWFEYLLSQIAVYFDPEMLVVSNLRYASPATILFQRLSVVVLDAFLFHSVYFYVTGATRKHPQHLQSNARVQQLSVLVLMIFCPGLLLVDHIHFQYNGFLFAILVYSIGCLIRERYILGALLFAILLCFKHIFVYTAPVYLVYLFSQYVLQLHQTFAARAVAFLKLGISVLSVVAAAFAPFVYQGQLWIVLERLFPFGDRGLCHAYWAPNVWALYNVVDKVLEKLLQVPVDPEAVSMTSGLVENFQHSVLPEVTPLHTLGLTVFTMLPALWILARNPTKATFLTALSCVTFSSFLFGWHVHEKAILMVLVPLTLVCCESELAAKLFYLLTLSGTYSLFPLLFTMPEELIKVCLLVAFLLLAHLILTHSLATTTGQTLRLNILEQLYCVGFVGLHLVVVALPFVLPELQFLGLMLISVYTAVGVCHAYVLSWKLLLQANMATKAKQD